MNRYTHNVGKGLVAHKDLRFHVKREEHDEACISNELYTCSKDRGFSRTYCQM